MPPSPGVRLSRCCAYQGSFRKSSKSVVNSLSISAKVPVFQGFAEIIKVVLLKTLERASTAPKHNDPFDRLLLAQAKYENLKLVTHDSLLPYYGEDCIMYV